ncbi:MAG: Spy/CpxP family protein refolding chaperone [Candidatus Krumholzibacteria bacterium]|nr:Spy/CpxP family protein refolding chaperone [Candidatus Krumholzibacteria bacterium]
MNARTNNGMKILVFLTLASVMLLGAGTVLAQGWGAGPGHGGRGGGPGYGVRGGFGDGEFGPGHRMEFLADHLELTDEQITAIEGIQSRGQAKNMELRKEMMRLRNELQSEMLKDDPSEKVVLDLTGKIGALRSEVQTNRLSSRLEVRKQLTPEQRDKMLMLHERFQGREGRRGGGRGMGPCGDGYGLGRRGARGNW